MRALVLELVEGETVADRIARGPIPLDDALAIARQIAEALEAAHSKGIVHRDLKPANVKITPDGIAKVLDFGIAKTSFEAPEADPTRATTVAVHGTRAGAILGTPSYMSPEQARGQAVDKRTDMWSFGCLLYEMLTGEAGVRSPRRRCLRGRAEDRTRLERAAAGHAASDPTAAAPLPHEGPKATSRRCVNRSHRNRRGADGIQTRHLLSHLQDPSDSACSSSRPSPLRQ